MTFEIESTHNVTYRFTEEEANAFTIVSRVMVEMESHLGCLEDCYAVLFNNNEIYMANGDGVDPTDVVNASNLIYGILYHAKKI